MRSYTFVAVYVFLTGQCFSFPDQPWMDTLDQLVSTLMDCHQIPGLSLTVVHGNDTLARGYGVTSYEDYGQAVDEDTVFAIGSLSKSMTSALLAKLFSQDESGSDWDTPLFSLLCPRLVLSNDVRTMQTTCRDLLTHRMGVPGYFGGLMGNFELNITREQFTKRLQHMDHTLPFRQFFSYNNNFYILAGFVAEQLSGGDLTWEELITEELFIPLGMDSTTFLSAAPDLDNMSRPYVRVNGSLVEDDLTILSSQWYAGPAGSVLSTAADMEKWLDFHLQDGRNQNGEQVVDSDWLLETRVPQIELSSTALGIENITHYCLGLDYGTYRGVERWRHGGAMNPTYISRQTLHPDLDLGIFTSTSGSHDGWSTYATMLIHFFIEDVLIFNETWIPDDLVDFLCPEELPDDISDYSYSGKLGGTHHSRDVEGIMDNNDNLQHGTGGYTQHAIEDGVDLVHHDKLGKIRSLEKDEQEGSNQDYTQNAMHSGRDDHRRVWDGPKQYENIPEAKVLSQYTGKYGHPAFGNITIDLNATDATLYLDYGYVSGYLRPGVRESVFSLMLTGVYWSSTEAEGTIGGSLNGFHIEFLRSRPEGPYDILICELIEPRYQVPFVRGVDLPVMRDIPCLDV